MFVKNKDRGEGGGRAFDFPPLKRGRLFERGAQKRSYGNLIIVCKTVPSEKLVKNIYIPDCKVSPRASFVECYLYVFPVVADLSTRKVMDRGQPRSQGSLLPALLRTTP